jgi:serine/threonine protein kinase
MSGCRVVPFPHRVPLVAKISQTSCSSSKHPASDCTLTCQVIEKEYTFCRLLQRQCWINKYGGQRMLIMPRLQQDLYTFVNRYVYDETSTSTVIEDLSRLLPVAIALCEEIANLHQLSIAHLDIKPENIVLNYNDMKTSELRPACSDETTSVAMNAGAISVDRRDSGSIQEWLSTVVTADANTIRLIDWASATRATTLDVGKIGTPRYCAPEVWKGGLAYTPIKADIWSLGATLYTLFSGYALFHTRGDIHYQYLKRCGVGKLLRWNTPQYEAWEKSGLLSLLDHMLHWDAPGRPSAQCVLKYLHTMKNNAGARSNSPTISGRRRRCVRSKSI